MKKIFSIATLAMGASLAMTASAVTPAKAILNDANAYKASKVVKAADDTETWKNIGKGLFRENLVHVYWLFNQYPEIEVEIQESEQTPGRYRLVNPYANYPDYIGSPGCTEGDSYIYINASDPKHVYIEMSPTGYIVGDEQELLIWSKADDYYNNLYGDWEEADKDGVCGQLRDGSIMFPHGGVLANLYAMDSGKPFDPSDYAEMWRPGDDMFRVLLPGALNLDVFSTFVGYNKEANTVQYSISLGDDITSAKMALVEGQDAEQMVKDVIDGKIASTVITETKNYDLPFPGDGMYTIVVVPYVGEEVKEYKAFTSTREFAYDESEWRKTGQASYTEGILSSCELNSWGLNMAECTYAVEVEENVARPGYLRMVNAYNTTDYPESRGHSIDTSRNYYIYIDATDPDHVVLEQTPESEGIGLNMGYGKIYFATRGQRYLDNPDLANSLGYTTEMCKAIMGKFFNDEITFPKEALNVRMDVAPMTWYYANEKGNFKLAFQPGQIIGEQSSGVENVNIDDVNAPVEYYRIDGTRVSASQLTPGIYVVRQGSKTSKQVIR